MNVEIHFRVSSPVKPVIILPTYINGKGPFEFALDTGASMTVVTAELAQKLGLKLGEPKEGIGAGGKVQVAMSTIDSVAIGEAKRENLQVVIADLTALSQASGTKLGRIIGYNFLKDFRLTIDYPSQALRLA